MSFWFGFLVGFVVSAIATVFTVAMVQSLAMRDNFEERNSDYESEEKEENSEGAIAQHES